MPEELTTDSALQFMSSEVKDFIDTWLPGWEVHHHVTSAYNLQSNMRAETAVTTVKKLLMDNMGGEGSLDTDKFMAALLQYHNIPIQDINLIPSLILIARQMRDRLTVKMTQLQKRPEWVFLKCDRKAPFRKQHVLEVEKWKLVPLTVGTLVLVQNQTGPIKGNWEVSGAVMEVLVGNSYNIQLDGSNFQVSKILRF